MSQQAFEIATVFASGANMWQIYIGIGPILQSTSDFA
jgi:hypothetical protein